MAADPQRMEKLVALCKRRGFIFPSSEIYGGIGGFWDYGPLGVELKRNIKAAWWQDMVTSPPDPPEWSGLRELEMVGVDCTIIMNPKVWEASGHAGGFADEMQSCLDCRKLFRADQVEAQVEESQWYQELCDIWAEGDQVPINALKRWAQKRGKAAPALGLVRDTDAVLAALEHVASETKVAETQRAFSNMIFDADGQRFVSDVCPNCGGRLTEPRQFNLMFESHAGALKDAASRVYLRPETAQGIFANFLNVLDTARVKVPFGIAQVGKAFRNEINPRNFIFRSREFEQMEIEFFCHDGDALKWWEFWRDVRIEWYKKLGLSSEKLRPRNQEGDELAHYSKACTDIEYLFPFSDEPQELEGVAHRGCYDLQQHMEHAGRDLRYFDDDGWQGFMRERKERGEPDLSKEQKAEAAAKFRYLPTVIEPSAGADRAALAFLCEAYTEDEAPNEKGKLESRVVMRFHPRLAPIKAAFLPLVNKEGMPEIAHALYREARRRLNVFFDEGGSIGRRYRRQDEAGTPFCITVDGQTLEDGTVTVRDRDSLAQERIAKDRVLAWLEDKLT